MFYTIEQARQKYLDSIEVHPLMALVAASAFFVRYALRAPMTSKLYKEFGYSLLFGFATTYPYPYYYNQKYVDVIEECYDIVLDKFQQNPKFFNNED